MLQRVFFLLVMAAIVCPVAEAQPPALEKEPPPATKADLETESKPEHAVRRSGEQYTTAFNVGDAAAIADLYAENAELTDSSGNVFRGRESIQQEYASFFETYPEAEITLTLEEGDMLSPMVAVERGRTETKLGSGQPIIRSRYTAIHGIVGDKWKMFRVVDIVEEPSEPGANLEQLSWMIGRWVDEDRESLVEIDCYWDASGSFLIREFKLRVQGLLEASGTERIGWDPLREEIRSWVFDSKGGYIEASWKPTEDGWTVSAQGYRADGEPTKAIYVLTPMKKDAYHMASIERFAGKLRLDDLDMTIVRSPPLPANTEEPSSESSTGTSSNGEE